MQISDILSSERIRCNIGAGSKKAALEIVSELIASAESSLTQAEVFDSLLARERLGSTGLGHGIALPHGRRKHGNNTIGAFIRLQSSINYDAIDQQPVDILFALLVPAESTQEHLEILSKLAEMFSKDDFLAKLRAEGSNDEIFKLLSI